MTNYDVLIVGGGSVGCAIAYALSRYDLKVAVAEKELDVGMGTSGRNSGVVHAGFNNRPGSLMAKLCVEGNEGFEALCKMLDIPYKRTGKLIVGYDEADHQALIKLKEQGEKNGVKGLEIIDGADRRVQPLPLLHPPGGGFGPERGPILPEQPRHRRGSHGGGLPGPGRGPRPHLPYPDQFGGPLRRQGVRHGRRPLLHHLPLPGRILPAGQGDLEDARELRAEAEVLLPVLNMRTVIGTYAGVRPKLVKKGEANFGDFVIERSPKAKHLINLIGIESPGITASMPIARMVLDILSEDTELVEKPDFVPTYRGIPPFAELSRAEQRALIEQDPDYGDVVCRCETVTRAQVKRALHNPIGATGVIAVKNRTRSTMGRCNGGYCFQRIVELLLSEGKSPQDIDLKRRGDRPLLGYVKGGQA